MRVLVTGIRDFVDPRVIPQAIRDSGFDVSQLVTGTFTGVEQQVSAWGRETGVPVVLFKPDWPRFRLKASAARNNAMLDAAEAVVVIWTGNDSAKVFVTEARKRKLPLHLHHV